MPRFLWWLVFGSLPALLLPAMFGVFGVDAQSAAQDVCAGLLVLVAVALLFVLTWAVVS